MSGSPGWDEFDRRRHSIYRFMGAIYASVFVVCIIVFYWQWLLAIGAIIVASFIVVQYRKGLRDGRQR